MNLYKFNAVIGRWDLARECTNETAKEWLAIWQKAEPDTTFKLASKRPITDIERALKRKK